MIVDRYPPKRLFRLVPDLPQAFAPELAQLDRLLEDDAIFCRIKADMARRRPHSRSLGRPGTPVEVVLRLLVLKRLHGWSYEELERFERCESAPAVPERLLERFERRKLTADLAAVLDEVHGNTARRRARGA